MSELENNEKDIETLEDLNSREEKSVVGLIIRRIYSPFSKSHPNSWPNRTFLLIVGKIYLALLKNNAISPKELLDLARSFTECCKNQGKLGKNGDAKNASQNGASESSSSQGMLDGLKQLVQQIYGTNLQVAETSVLPAAATDKTKSE